MKRFLFCLAAVGGSLFANKPLQATTLNVDFGIGGANVQSGFNDFSYPATAPGEADLNSGSQTMTYSGISVTVSAPDAGYANGGGEVFTEYRDRGADHRHWAGQSTARFCLRPRGRSHAHAVGLVRRHLRDDYVSSRRRGRTPSVQRDHDQQRGRSSDRRLEYSGDDGVCTQFLFDRDVLFHRHRQRRDDHIRQIRDRRNSDFERIRIAVGPRAIGLSVGGCGRAALCLVAHGSADRGRRRAR